MNENESRLTTRAKAHNFHTPRICTDTFVYTAIKDWNNLPQTIKEIKSENLFKEKVKLHLMKLSEKEENKVFL